MVNSVSHAIVISMPPSQAKEKQLFKGDLRTAFYNGAFRGEHSPLQIFEQASL